MLQQTRHYLRTFLPLLLGFTIALLGTTSAWAAGNDNSGKADDQKQTLKQDKGPSIGNRENASPGKDKDKDKDKGKAKSDNTVKKKAAKKAGAAAVTGIAAGAATKKLKSGVKDD